MHVDHVPVAGPYQPSQTERPPEISGPHADASGGDAVLLEFIGQMVLGWKHVGAGDVERAGVMSGGVRSEETLGSAGTEPFDDPENSAHDRQSTNLTSRPRQTGS